MHICQNFASLYGKKVYDQNRYYLGQWLIGRAVASDTRGPRFGTSHQYFFYKIRLPFLNQGSCGQFYTHYTILMYDFIVILRAIFFVSTTLQPYLTIIEHLIDWPMALSGPTRPLFRSFSVFSIKHYNFTAH